MAGEGSARPGELEQAVAGRVAWKIAAALDCAVEPHWPALAPEQENSGKYFGIFKSERTM